jgi:hypothetical protein
LKFIGWSLDIHIRQRRTLIVRRVEPRHSACVNPSFVRRCRILFRVLLRAGSGLTVIPGGKPGSPSSLWAQVLSHRFRWRLQWAVRGTADCGRVVRDLLGIQTLPLVETDSVSGHPRSGRKVLLVPFPVGDSRWTANGRARLLPSRGSKNGYKYRLSRSFALPTSLPRLTQEHTTCELETALGCGGGGRKRRCTLRAGILFTRRCP